MPQDDFSPWMDHALALAGRGAGFVSPNPLVGAVLLSDEGELLGEGWHGAYGGPHAEVWAVEDAKKRGFAHRLSSATLMVTLEPCSHLGKTPPCADLIIREAIPRVVIATEDPNPLVAGRGVARLREAGVRVDVGLRGDQARRLNEPFFRHVTTGMPLVTLKMAQTLDGRVATRTGDSQWVTGLPSRTLTHRWRAEMDAVLVGSGTARMDDPQLTIRHSWPGRPERDPRRPLRVVLDREGTLPSHLRLFTDEHADRTVVATQSDVVPDYGSALTERGGHILTLPHHRDGHLDLKALFQRLGEGMGPYRPVQSVLVEAGPGLATALLMQNLVDRLFVFVAPRLLGDGVPSIGNLDVQIMSEALAFAHSSWELIGEDMLFRGFLREI